MSTAASSAGASGLARRVSTANDAAEVRRRAAALAVHGGFDLEDAGRVTLVATELASNLANHAVRGIIAMQLDAVGGQPALNVLALDRGPGMIIDRARRDGFSSSGSLGTGLGAVIRTADAVDVDAGPEQGTLILAQISAGGTSPARASAMPGAISLALPGQSECGDAWAVDRRPRGSRLLVVDGIGHGPIAAVAAQTAREVFFEAPAAPPAALLQLMHERLTGTRGAAAAVVNVDETAGTITFAGVGNIAATLVSATRSQGMLSRYGTLGHEVRSIREYTHDLAEGVLIMHTDGISQRGATDAVGAWLGRHPLLLAGLILRDHGRDRDDATVVVLPIQVRR